MKIGLSACSAILILVGLLFTSAGSLRAQVVINELMVFPGGDPPSRTNSLYTECDRVGGATTETWEWIEIYNSSICDTVDISCFTLAANNDNVPNICSNAGEDGLNAGAFTFPPGTRIPPLGFITVGGVNGGRDSDFDLKQFKSRGYLCTGRRWFLDNKGGWLALYDPNALVVDAVYWGSGDVPRPDIVRTDPMFGRDVSSNCTCDGGSTVVSFPSARSLAQRSQINFIGNVGTDFFSNGRAQFLRQPDGGSWRSNLNTPTPGTCNDRCVIPGDLVYITPKGRTICPGDSVLLTALPFNPAFTGLQYSWRSEPPGIFGSTQSIPFFLNKTALLILTTRRGACIDIDTAVVSVLDEPAPNFRINPWRLCTGDTATITYLSPAMPGVTYEWSFDGGRAVPGTGPGPHRVVWNTAGTKTVGLLVRNSQCSSDYRYEAAEVAQGPVASYITDKDSLCGSQRLTVTFDGSAGAGAVFSWNFDGGTATPGTGRGPHTVTWTSPGRKTLRLTVRENGCSSNEVIRNIWVGTGVNAEYNIAPSPVCLGDSTVLTLTSPPAAETDYRWEVEDGITVPGTGAVPQKIKWNRIGRKKITLTVRSPGCPPQVTERFVNVLPSPEINLTAVPETVCVNERTRIELNLTGSDAGNWSFDGGTAVPGSGTGNQTVLWDQPGIKTVSFTAAAGECTIRKEVKINVVPGPTAAFEVAPKEICVNDDETQIRFTGFGPGTPDYEWNFDGGTAVPALGAGPFRVKWNAPGRKNITLRLRNGNCFSELFSDTVHVKPRPSAGFTLTPNPACAGEPVTVTYTGGASAGAVFQWDFAGLTPVTEEPNRKFRFNPSAGERTFNLQVTESGCESEENRQNLTVYALPEARFSVFPNDFCSFDTVTLTFTGTASDFARLNWQLSGGNLISGSGKGPFRAVWTSDGTKNISLEVNDRSCIDRSAFSAVNVRFTPTADFTMQPDRICAGDTVRVTYTGTGTPAALLNWNLDGGGRLPGGTVRDFQLIWPDAGEKNVRLRVSEGSCPPQNAFRTVNITPYPVADFLIEPSPACAGQEVTVSFTGTAQPGADFRWDFESGTVVSGSGSGPVRVKWDREGSYSVNLRVRQSGCASELVNQTIRIKPVPTSEFTLTPDEVCQNEPVTVKYSGLITGKEFFWQMPGADRETDRSPQPASFRYAEVGNRTVTLQVIQEGCPAEPYSLNVRVKKVPTSEFIFSRPVICAGDTVRVIFTGEAGPEATFFPQGTGLKVIDDRNPRNMLISYSDSGLKMFSLQTVEDGCTSVVTVKNVRVLPIPKASFTARDKVFCKNAWNPIRFTGYAPRGTEFEWDFGGAEVNLNRNPAGPHSVKYSDTGNFVIRLKLRLNVCESEPAEMLLKTIDPKPDFEVTSPICLNERAILKIKGNVPKGSAFMWSIENGRIAVAEGDSLFQLQFNSPGSKRVGLKIVSEGCTSEEFRRFVGVYDFPRGKISAVPDSGRVPLTVQFSAETDTAGAARLWTFGDGDTSIEDNPEHKYIRHGEFEPTLLLTNANRCSTLLKLKVEVATREIYIPNAFSPNGDDVNEKFLILNLPGVLNYQFSIFNRWGKKIFETTDINEFWDGSFNGTPVPEGSYVYHLVAEEYDGYIFTKAGTVTLIR